MRLHTCILILFVVAGAFAGVPPQTPEPMTQGQIMDLVKAGMESPALINLIREHGIDFDLAQTYLQALRQAGAPEAVIQALRAVRPKPLNKQQVLKLVAGHVPSQRAIMLVKQHGIDFPVDDEYLKTLRLAGADEGLMGAVREASQVLQVNPKDGLKYKWIPPGTFVMGCAPTDKHCRSDERPVHQVAITKGFWFGQTPVTVEAYKRFAQGTGRSMPGAPTLAGRLLNPDWGKNDLPMVDVSWDDAHAYCGWIGGNLPTEAQWEYAARGGTTDVSYGSLDDIAWYGDNSGLQRMDSARIWDDPDKAIHRFLENGNEPHPVAGKQPNSFGLFDMLGNAQEWVGDWYDWQYYQTSPSPNPQGPATGQERVVRGGNFLDSPEELRVSYRKRDKPDSRYGLLGFRCAREVGSD